ncbi:MAG TPA: phosphatase PAP2 family protein [Chitinophagaceae bacterium]|jgi:undecaprenyl-diphosphatase|nr:phosphatase PAP2 family protein [Chitinophagaceae bacterium]
MDTLKSWDQWFFIKVNSEWTNAFFDKFMPFMRNPLNWAPLYIFILVFILLNFKKQGWWWVLFFTCTVALTDMVGNHAFKHIFERLRPCNDPGFAFHVRLLLGHCSGGYSFTSNHAANHFGMATFFYFTLRNTLGRWVSIGFVWAALISYAQVYVGVHYPLDIIGGALLGIILGLFTGMLFNKRFGFTNFGLQPTA